MRFLLIPLITLLLTVTLQAKEWVQFPSLDGLTVSADLYKLKDPKSPVIILFHQAGWSRGEYNEIAPKLNDLGFSCLAVDLRSGGKINGVVNETFQNAVEKKYKTYYLNAYIDMAAAVAYVQKNIKPSKLIIWGSSYSSSLVFKLGADFSSIVHAILAFSPGEYFENSSEKELSNFVKYYALLIQQPVFVTSARDEKDMWSDIFEAIPHSNKQHFVPTTKGFHGSRALWEENAGNEMYWKAVKKYLDKF